MLFQYFDEPPLRNFPFFSDVCPLAKHMANLHDNLKINMVVIVN